jgi:protein TonB
MILLTTLHLALGSTLLSAEAVRVGGQIKEPRKVRHVNPRYPPEAYSHRIQDVVFMDCVIDPTGKVSDVKILRGHPALAAAAETAVRQWEYTPTLLDGVAMSVVLTVTVTPPV